MPDTENFPRKELDHLMAGLCDGRLSEAENQRLEDLLLASAEARRHYHYYLDLHLTLADRVERQQSLDPEGVVRFPRKKAWWTPRVLGLAAAVALMLGGALFIFRDAGEAPPVAKESKEPQVAVAVAVVRSSDAAVWSGRDLGFGSELMAEESHELLRGDVVLRFFNGAELSIRGPAKFEVLSDEQVFVEYGKLAARVPPAAAGFTVLSKRTAFVDLGTEFSLNLDRQGTADLIVHDGLVVANLLGENGTTQLSSSAEAGTKLRVDAAQGTIRENPGTADGFLKPITIKPESFVVPEAYREAVRAARPLGYWSFEQVDETGIPNEMGDNHAARLYGAATPDQIGENTAAYFPPGKETAGIAIEELFTGLNLGQGYTIELWFNPEMRHQATLAALDVPRPPDEVRSDPKGLEVRNLALIEMLGHAHDHRGMISRAYTLRQNHRSPAGNAEGVNAFTSARYGALRWQHLVAVTKPGEMILYLNGEVIQRVRHASPAEDEAFRLTLGRLRPPEYAGRERQFQGHIDEVAIYGRPLDESEVVRHWRIIADASKGN